MRSALAATAGSGRFRPLLGFCDEARSHRKAGLNCAAPQDGAIARIEVARIEFRVEIFEEIRPLLQEFGPRLGGLRLESQAREDEGSDEMIDRELAQVGAPDQIGGPYIVSFHIGGQSQEPGIIAGMTGVL